MRFFCASCIRPFNLNMCTNSKTAMNALFVVCIGLFYFIDLRWSSFLELRVFWKKIILKLKNKYLFMMFFTNSIFWDNRKCLTGFYFNLCHRARVCMHFSSFQLLYFLRIYYHRLLKFVELYSLSRLFIHRNKQDG